MTAFLLRRAAGGLLVALIVTGVVFALAPVAQSQDPADRSGDVRMTEEELEAARERLGLSDPLHVQYGRWLSSLVFRGDLGDSLLRNQPVTQALITALPVTLSIAAFALVVVVVISLPVGVVAAVHPGSFLDRAVLVAASVGVAVPTFLAGLLLVFLLGVHLGLFPTIGYVAWGDDPVKWFHHIVLPGLALGLPHSAVVTRYVRASMLEVLHKDYVRTAKGKGLTGRSVLWKHSLKNALAPVTTALGLETKILLGGSVAVETVFALPGVGTLTVRAVIQGDYPMLLGVVVFMVATVLIINLVVDWSYAYTNPRVRTL